MKEEDKDKLVFCALPIASETMLFGCDVMEGYDFPSLVPGNNTKVMLAPSTEDEAKRLFSVLSEGGKITVKQEKAVWESLYGECIDKFGIHRGIDFSYSDDVEPPQG